MPSTKLDKVISCLHLVSLPSVAMEVLALMRKPNVSISEIAKVVQNDQALCAKILKTANSSFYGLARPCPTISRALTYFGLSAVKSLVLGFSLVDTTQGHDGGLDLIAYWRRGIYSAAAARRIASLGIPGATGQCDPEEAFVAALMCDIGMPAMHKALNEDYLAVVEEAQGDHDRLPPLERSRFGFDHAEAGGRLAERWRLPKEIINAIRGHHDLEIPAQQGLLVRIVALAYQAAATLCNVRTSAALARFRHNAQQWLSLPEEQSDALLAAISQDAQQFSKLFQVNTGDASDINAILAEAEQAALEHQLSVSREAESLRRLNLDLAEQAVTDSLTGVGNRARFEDDLRTSLRQAQACRGLLAVILIDVDHFKLVNDTFGHAAGDQVLIEIAQRLVKKARETGVVCRWGGEEFAMVMRGFELKIAARVAESMRAAIADAPMELRNVSTSSGSVNVTISVGVAMLDDGTRHTLTSPDLLLQAADRAMFEAKAAGRNCVRFFDSAIAEAA